MRTRRRQVTTSRQLSRDPQNQGAIPSPGHGAANGWSAETKKTSYGTYTSIWMHPPLQAPHINQTAVAPLWCDRWSWRTAAPRCRPRRLRGTTSSRNLYCMLNSNQGLPPLRGSFSGWNGLFRILQPGERLNETSTSSSSFSSSGFASATSFPPSSASSATFPPISDRLLPCLQSGD